MASCDLLLLRRLKKRIPYTARADQQPQYQAERARCAGYGLVAKFSSKITNSSDQKEKEKENECEVVASAMRTH